MTHDKWQRMKGIAADAFACPEADRATFVAEACRDDSALRKEVDSLLQSMIDAIEYFEPPMIAPVPRSFGLLSPGARLGRYEILGLIGSGGMGDVYKARDSRLNRAVALKILPPTLACDPEFRERFDREARAISRLTHPHICTLHDIGEHAGTAYLVMELLDGETLAARLAKGALKIDQALRTAIEIAGAMVAAHRAGIVHRDLKPGNIFLVHRGGASAATTAKLLDFGLATTSPVVQVVTIGVAGGPESPRDGLSARLTTPAHPSADPTILGTLQYMAPEQIEGRDVDARSDIFAFGAVLYEMVAGKRAFEAETEASLIAAIRSGEPPSLSTVQPITPPALDRVVATCLAKDPDDRWQTARDLLRELTWIVDSGSGTHFVCPNGRTQKVRGVGWSVVVGALLLVAAFAVVAQYGRRTVSEAFSTSFEISTPPTNEPLSFALSPNGRQLAFVAKADGASKLWLRPLEQVRAQALAGTEGASYPFWSPDGRALGFFADGKLKRVDVAGNTLRVLADAPNGRGGSWNREDVIVFAPTTAGVLMRVPATGGTAVRVTRLAPGQNSHRWPQFLPDGRRFLFVAAQGQQAAQGVFVDALDGGEPTRVLADETPATYAPPGRLLVVRAGGLIALRFDPARAVVSGPAIQVAQAVGSDTSMVRGAFSVSETGVLALRTSLAERRQFMWVDRAGTTLGTIGPADDSAFAGPALARDGHRLALFRTLDGNTDVWLMEVLGGVLSRFSFDAKLDFFPVWTPDGRRIIFASNRNTTYDLYEKPASREREEQPLLVSTAPKLPMDCSSDGRFLLYATQVPMTGVDLWALPLVGERKPFPVVETPFDEMAGQFSPDGRWFAYQSNESGRMEIHVRPFPGPGGESQVSSMGGTQPRWRRDGRELFYVAADGNLMAVGIDLRPDGQSLSAQVPVPLFQTHLASGANVLPAIGWRPQYDVGPDGRFLVNMAVEGATAPPINVVLNWDAPLYK